MTMLLNSLTDCESIDSEDFGPPESWPDWTDDRWELGPDPEAVRTVKAPELPRDDDAESCYEWRIQSRAFRLRNHGPDCPYCNGRGDEPDPADLTGGFCGHHANEEAGLPAA